MMRLGTLALLAALACAFLCVSPAAAESSRIAFGSLRDVGTEVLSVGLYSVDVATGSQDLLYDGIPNAVWSSDAAQVLFHRRDERDQSDIYIMDANGANRRNLTEHPASDIHPAWSPDGSKIAFVSDREQGHDTDIFVMDADGKNVQNLTRIPRPDSQPDWSPDGKHIVFRSTRDSTDFVGWPPEAIRDEIYVMDADGSNPRRLTDDRVTDADPAWSPDGAQILIERPPGGNQSGLVALSVDGSSVREVGRFDGALSGATWSSDGTEIALALRGDIHVISPDGANQRNLTPQGGLDYAPEWIPPQRATTVMPAHRALMQWGWLKQLGRAR